MKIILILILSSGVEAFAGQEYMSSMPKISPKQIYEVTDPEALEAESGFGDQAPMVKMMNLMMVEGSGYEGMDMSQMKLSDAKAPADKSMRMDSMPDVSEPQIELTKSPTPPKTGSNIYQFTVKDKSGKPMKGLKLKTQVYMLSMDMGTETPEVKEIKPGIYQTKAPFSMSGPWAIKIVTPFGEKVFNVKVGN